MAAGVDPPQGLAEAVHTQTEGNPLFVTEVVRLLVQEGELSSESGNRDSWTVRIPEGVREVIGRRLKPLPRPSLHAALSMAFAGDKSQARLYASDAVALAERVGDRFSLGSALWASEITYGFEGELNTAREFNDKALAGLPMDPRSLTTRVALEYQVGDFNQGQAYLERLMGAMRLSPSGGTVGN